MKIIENSEYKERKNDPDFLKTIYEILFQICKSNKIVNNIDLNLVEKEELKIKKKLKKKQKLLKESESLIKLMNNKISNLDDEIFTKRAVLLEKLGSEI